MNAQRVLVIGATGMLGRPVVRRLIDEGFSVRAMVRDVDRAKAMLPAHCEIVRGDVRDDQRLLRAIDNCDAAYTNLAVPMTRCRPEWDVEVDGSQAVIAAMRSAGLRRLVRISAMGLDRAPPDWWAAASKREADRIVMHSGLDATVLQPTWLMESLCTFRIGRWMMCPDLTDAPLRWIAGDDYARVVSAALRDERFIGRVAEVEGPEALTIKQALRRFVNAWTHERLRMLPTPMWLADLGAPFSGKANYLAALMRMTRAYASTNTLKPRDANANIIPVARMTIEDYARYVERTGDWPRK